MHFYQFKRVFDLDKMKHLRLKADENQVLRSEVKELEQRKSQTIDTYIWHNCMTLQYQNWMKGEIRQNSADINSKSLGEITVGESMISPETSFDVNPQDLLNFQNLEKTSHPYNVDYQQIIGAKLSQMQRYKMMKWVLNQSDRRQYTREVFARSCYYLDLYIAKESSIKPEDLQLMALGALMISVKMEGIQFPKIGGQISMTSILEFEKSICLTLNYFLNPQTYVTLLDNYICLWDDFAIFKKLNTQDLYKAQSGAGFYKGRVLYQKMESVNMVALSLKNSIHDLVLNFFYLQNKLNEKGLNPVSMSLEDLQLFIQQSYADMDEYQELFEEFIVFCWNNDFDISGSLNLVIGKYLIPFLMLPIDSTPPTRKAINYEMYSRLQTLSCKSLKTLDNLVKILK